MNEATFITQRRLLTLAAILEIGTGLALLLMPAVVIILLLGISDSGAGLLVGRFLGITLISLGVSCWPCRDTSPSAFWGMLIYNALVALYLGGLGATGLTGGLLLWPAAVLHAVMAVLLIWKR